MKTERKKCLQDLGVLCSLYMAVDCKPQVFKKLVSKLEENLPGLVVTMNT